MVDLDQAIAALNKSERGTLLHELISALHAENTDRCYQILRDWGLEEDLEEKDKAAAQ